MRKSSAKGIWSIVSYLLTMAVAVFLILTFVMHNYVVNGESMEPTLHNGDRIIVSKLGRTKAMLFNQQYLPNRGDIIVFKNPIEDPEHPILIKRVIGLPGERVVLRNGTFTIYNKLNPKGFDPDKKAELELNLSEGSIDEVVESDHLFVSGDNRTPGGSLDSRNSLGQVPLQNILGRAAVRIFPLTSSRSF